MKYRIKKISPNIFAVVVSDDYERAMLFCRVQEFYESPNPKFKNSSFSIWDYFRWYSKNGSGCFSYVSDFVGFNLPLVVAKKCYQMNESETPYDDEMMGVIDKLFVNGERQYLIGVDDLANPTFYHELAHALYYTDTEYRISMDKITKTISKENMAKFRKNLYSVGYCSDVVKDEIQAYMATEMANKKITKGVTNKKKLHQKYKSVFKKFMGKIST
jgi:hypothetical protein